MYFVILDAVGLAVGICLVHRIGYRGKMFETRVSSRENDIRKFNVDLK